MTLIYATPEGDRHLTKQLAPNLLRRKRITAATDVEVDKLEPVTDEETRERNATEAQRSPSATTPTPTWMRARRQLGAVCGFFD